MFRNASFYLIALLGLIIAGFWPSYFSVPPADLRLSLHVHGISMLLWLSLLIAQPWLIRTRRNDLHRSLGKVSFVLLPILAITGTVIVFEDYARNYAEPFSADALGVFFVGFWLVAMMVGFYGFAIYHRKNVQLHARCMLATAMALVVPGAFRLYSNLGNAEDFGAAFFTTTLWVSIIPLALIVGDKLRGRIYPPFVYLTIAWAINVAGFKLIYHLAWWQDFAAWSLELYS